MLSAAMNLLASQPGAKANARRGFVMLALVALSLLLLRPLCEAFEARAGHSPAASAAATQAGPAVCCSLSEPVFAASAEAIAPLAKPIALGAAPALVARAYRSAAPAVRIAAASAFPPRTPAYYVRSARILR